MKPLVTILALLLAGCAAPGAFESAPSPSPPLPSPATEDPLAAIERIQARVDAGIVTQEDHILGRMGPGHWIRFKHSGDCWSSLMTNPISGKVLATDPAWNLSFVSVGSKDGVKIGDRFVITRSGRYVAMARVDKVFDDKSCFVIRRIGGWPTKTSDVRVGDTVESGL